LVLLRTSKRTPVGLLSVVEGSLIEPEEQLSRIEEAPQPGKQGSQPTRNGALLLYV
jgi:hypothetical protein